MSELKGCLFLGDADLFESLQTRHMHCDAHRLLLLADFGSKDQFITLRVDSQALGVLLEIGVELEWRIEPLLSKPLDAGKLFPGQDHAQLVGGIVCEEG